ncbi:MAG: amidohydrolase family protein [Candidatus Diapherotrites archaeon]|nr:amidohydrolase family protein [Candidatus Diapherotrites archaeon]
MEKVFDTHFHIGHFGSYPFTNNLPIFFDEDEHSTVEAVKAKMNKLGISAAVIMPHYTPEKPKSFNDFNPLVWEAIKKEEIYGGLWVSPEPEVWELTEKVFEKIKQENNKKIVVLKMSPDSQNSGRSWDPACFSEHKEYSEKLFKIIDFAAENNLVIQTHTGTNNSDIKKYAAFVEQNEALLLEKKVKIDFIHSGGTAGGQIKFANKYFFDWIDKGLDFYADLSFSRDFGVRLLIKRAMQLNKGLDRILFASDEPWGSFRARLTLIKEMNLPEEIESKILWGNAEHLFIK